MTNEFSFLPEGTSMDQFIADSSYEELMHTYRLLVIGADHAEGHTSAEIGAVFNGALDKIIPEIRQSFEESGVPFHEDQFREAALMQHVMVNGASPMMGPAPLDSYMMRAYAMSPDIDVSAVNGLTRTIEESNRAWRALDTSMDTNNWAGLHVYSQRYLAESEERLAAAREAGDPDAIRGAELEIELATALTVRATDYRADLEERGEVWSSNMENMWNGSNLYDGTFFHDAELRTYTTDDLLANDSWIAASATLYDNVSGGLQELDFGSLSFLEDNPEMLAALKRGEIPEDMTDDQRQALSNWGVGAMGMFNHNLTVMGGTFATILTDNFSEEGQAAMFYMADCYSVLDPSLAGFGRFVAGTATDLTTYAGIGLLAKVAGRGGLSILRSALSEPVQAYLQRRVAGELLETGAEVAAREGGERVIREVADDIPAAAFRAPTGAVDDVVIAGADDAALTVADDALAAAARIGGDDAALAATRPNIATRAFNFMAPNSPRGLYNSSASASERLSLLASRGDEGLPFMNRIIMDIRAGRTPIESSAIDGLRANGRIPQSVMGQLDEIQPLLRANGTLPGSLGFRISNMGNTLHNMLPTIPTASLRGAASALNTATFGPARLAIGSLTSVRGAFTATAAYLGDEFATGGAIREFYGDVYGAMVRGAGSVAEWATGNGGVGTAFDVAAAIPDADTTIAGELREDGNGVVAAVVERVPGLGGGEHIPVNGERTPEGPASERDGEGSLTELFNGMDFSNMGAKDYTQIGIGLIAGLNAFQGNYVGAAMFGAIAYYLDDILEIADNFLESQGIDIIPDHVYESRDNTAPVPAMG